jgi:hypothetical protein
LAVTLAFPLSVKVQVFALLPPLEHAPDQIASRPLATVSVMLVPVANDAEPVEPTVTLMPAGLDVTCSPLRPLAVTASVAVCAGGLTVRVAVRATPPALALIATGVDVATALVVIEKVALVAPCATGTLAGTVAAALPLDSVTTNPPAGAAAVNVTVPWELVPPVTLDGLTATADNAAGCETGLIVSAALRVTPPYAPPIVAVVAAEVAAVETVNVWLVAPAAIVMLAGSVAPVLLLVRVTTAPPDGAALVSVTVPVEVFPPTTVVGLSDSAESVGAVGAAPGVKRRTADHAPAVPAEFTPCTRHQWRTARSPVVVDFEAVTV